MRRTAGTRLFRCPHGLWDPVAVGNAEQAGLFFGCFDCALAAQGKCGGFGFCSDPSDVWDLVDSMKKAGMSIPVAASALGGYGIHVTGQTLATFLSRRRHGGYIPPSFEAMRPIGWDFQEEVSRCS